jgi:hypothetical protein
MSVNIFSMILFYSLFRIFSCAVFVPYFIAADRRIRCYLTGRTLGSSNSSSTTKRHRSNRDEELYQARMRQQEIYNQRAKEMLEENRRSESATGELIPDVATDKNPAKKSNKKKTAYTSSKSAASGGYNPMQPWTSSAGGDGYRYVTSGAIQLDF